MLELAYTVVDLGGGGEYLDDQAGIEQRITRFIEELRFAAYHNGVRIGVQAGCGHADAHVVHVCPAGALAELLAKLSGQIQDDQIVAFPRSGHEEHLALVVFALELRFSLDFEVLLGRDECFGLCGHTGLLKINVPRLETGNRRGNETLIGPRGLHHIKIQDTRASNPVYLATSPPAAAFSRSGRPSWSGAGDPEHQQPHAHRCTRGNADRLCTAPSGNTGVTWSY